MLYRILKKVIENGKNKGDLDVEDITKKCDVFWAAGKLTETEYTELTAMITNA